MEKEQGFPPTRLPEYVPKSPRDQCHQPCCWSLGMAETTASSGGLCPPPGTSTPQEYLPFYEITPTAPAGTAEKDKPKNSARNCKTQALFSHQVASVPHTFRGETHFCSSTSESPRSPVVSVLPALGLFLIYLELAPSHQLLYSLSHDI